ncbi:MAG: homocysteine S-methyltransferase family protein, partial [Verrucomicrobiota bacterium]|nr:homocysteine S-methyltransferase family protein [Verrucomicrobiota bacterium]
MRERIVILDGAMGTRVQQFKLTEADFRGHQFKNWKGKDLKGSNEALLLTKPDVIEQIHTDYLDAGSDIIETNTFSATTIGLHDFFFQGESTSGRKDPAFFDRVVNDSELQALSREMNLAAARLARSAADRAGKGRFVGGSLGPMPVTASISPDVNDPSFRAVTFDQLRQSYSEQAAALLEGGVDLLIVETIFDTVNAKAALAAISEIFESIGRTVPLIVSGTVTDLSGRTLTGQTVEAFLISIAHANPLVVGLNCALGPREMTPYIEELAHTADRYTSAYPNAGLPDPLSATGFPETPESLAPQLAEWAKNGWLNIVGGCCGTT